MARFFFILIDSNNDLKRELTEHLKQIDESQIKLNLKRTHKFKISTK